MSLLNYFVVATTVNGDGFIYTSAIVLAIQYHPAINTIFPIKLNPFGKSLKQDAEVLIRSQTINAKIKDSWNMAIISRIFKSPLFLNNFMPDCSPG